MPAYQWKGRNARGEKVSGEADAPDEDSLAAQLIASGVTPVELRRRGQASAEPRPSLAQSLLAQRVNGEDVLILSRQLFTLQKAGVPMLRALVGLEASAAKPALAALLADVRASLDQGRDLSAALARHPEAFDAFYVAMVRVGEMTGRLTEVFRHLAGHVEFELEVRARIRQALRYPAMVGVAILAALVTINLFVMPTFADMFASMKAELPPLTRLLLGVSDTMVRHWPLLGAAAAALVLGLRAALDSPAGRYRWDRLKLRLPIVGPIVLKATLARFARSFSLASRSGVPVSQAMTVVAETVDNHWVAARVEQMRDAVERGESLSRAAAASGVFTPVVMQMMAVGEETGALDELLDDIASLYERETDHAIKGLSSAIEPVLLLVIGTLVLVLALGVFTPMWNMGQAAMGRPH
ncbi:type II secretion system F family protein [Ideonella livida]|uniref:Type II secretion system F family protein n=1 Tax=Ideonella livida TaxID=2707176 RepID=A0A7C9THQ9_9BURK|nr:type II secretion system F family protein [Ideonella livida]NDY89864.1 type II secretion system F family protein [Ideonella livida]